MRLVQTFMAGAAALAAGSLIKRSRRERHFCLEVFFFYYFPLTLGADCTHQVRRVEGAGLVNVTAAPAAAGVFISSRGEQGGDGRGVESRQLQRLLKFADKTRRWLRDSDHAPRLGAVTSLPVIRVAVWSVAARVMASRLRDSVLGSSSVRSLRSSLCTKSVPFH